MKQHPEMYTVGRREERSHSSRRIDLGAQVETLSFSSFISSAWWPLAVDPVANDASDRVEAEDVDSEDSLHFLRNTKEEGYCEVDLVGQHALVAQLQAVIADVVTLEVRIVMLILSSFVIRWNFVVDLSGQGRALRWTWRKALCQHGGPCLVRRVANALLLLRAMGLPFLPQSSPTFLV
jgi:hypothetical protein